MRALWVSVGRGIRIEAPVPSHLLVAFQIQFRYMGYTKNMGRDVEGQACRAGSTITLHLNTFTLFH